MAQLQIENFGGALAVTHLVQMQRRRNGEDVGPSARATDVTDDAEATVKTVPYAKRSESRGAEVSGPVLVLIG